MRLQLVAAVAAVGFCCLGSQASAELVDVTYTGIVSYGSDMTGVFGIVDTSGSAYVGTAYTAKFVFDTSLASFSTRSLNVNSVYGGSIYGNVGPALSASVTVNGVTVSFIPSYFSEIYGFNTFGYGQQSHSARGYQATASGSRYETSSGHIHDFNAATTPAYIPADIIGPFTINAAPDLVAEELQYHLLSSLAGLQEATDVRATFQTLTVSPSVPEPSTWAMMLG